ncbi:SRPBCC family protein [Dyadobacter bucti]|uniref:SRPBCC family protein n=1 Tax=Dyadobacter bucti TaxID=2572203 RepID=UPI003F6ED89F
METSEKTAITVETTVNAPVEKVWKCWTEPDHITGWTFASDDWHAPYADNDLRKDGKFKTTMAAKDGSFSFDFGGTYTDVTEHSLIAYTMEDGRKVKVSFSGEGDTTKVVETFDPENTHPADFQKAGWQAILDNFKKYTEAAA